MHVVMVIGGGIAMLGLFLLFGRLWGHDTTSLTLAAGLFIPAWLGMSLINLWVGVHHAGYSMREELPILLLVFIVPAAVGGWTLWHFSR
jgi:hypothetical protein